MNPESTSVTVPDGEFTQYVWTPRDGGGTGILLIQEIFGVGDYIRAVAEDLAAMGHVVVAPDLFWRIRPEWESAHDEEGLKESYGLVSRFDFVKGLDDLDASLNHLRGLTPDVAIVGFCLGGTLAYALAARAQNLSAVVSFYGSRVPDQLNLMDEIDCPIQFHFGGNDPYIPREAVAAVERAVEGHSNAEIHVEESAGHAFHNRKAPMFYVPDAADRAWQLTEQFLTLHLQRSGSDS